MTLTHYRNIPAISLLRKDCEKVKDPERPYSFPQHKIYIGDGAETRGKSQFGSALAPRLHVYLSVGRELPYPSRDVHHLATCEGEEGRLLI